MHREVYNCEDKLSAKEREGEEIKIEEIENKILKNDIEDDISFTDGNLSINRGKQVL